MNRYLKVFVQISFFYFLSFQSWASELIWMTSAEISSMQISSGESSARYFLHTKNKWLPTGGYKSKAVDCPNPAYATIDADQPGADALLSVALTAKTTKTPVTLVGICGYHEAYFEIKRIIF